MLAKLNKLTNWQASIIIVIIGFAVYFDGLKNQFMGDDSAQIVINPVVHSISHIKLFFEGGTFYNGGGIAPLTGIYYRPLMTTVFSLIYTIFGAHPFYFHLAQLLLCIGSATLLYLFFRFSFKPALSLALSLIFLVHPLDSQVVFAIPSMQDALFFFFGILAMYLLFRLKSIKSLWVVALCLFLSLLSKETGILFVAMALLYLFWFNRKRLYPFMGIVVLPVLLWLILKINALGLSPKTHVAPIDTLSLAGRLFTAPSIAQYYLTKLVFPWKLASAYYWVYPHYTFKHFLIPLLVDLAALASCVYFALLVRRKASQARYYSYLFFAVWAILGIAAHLQLVSLDFTASDPWFYFSMAGVLGMIGIAVSALMPSMHRITWLNQNFVAVFVSILILLLGVRTAVWGTDWKDAYTLASNDVVASKEQFSAYDNLAIYYVNRGNYTEANAYAAKSVAIYPNATNMNTYGATLLITGNYPKAYTVLVKALANFALVNAAENLAQLTLVYGNPTANEQYLLQSVKTFPQDGTLWYYLAIQLHRNGDSNDAKIAISKLAPGQVPQDVYNGIMNNQSFTVRYGMEKTLVVQ